MCSLWKRSVVCISSCGPHTNITRIRENFLLIAIRWDSLADTHTTASLGFSFGSSLHLCTCPLHIIAQILPQSERLRIILLLLVFLLRLLLPHACLKALPAGVITNARFSHARTSMHELLNHTSPFFFLTLSTLTNTLALRSRSRLYNQALPYHVHCSSVQARNNSCL